MTQDNIVSITTYFIDQEGSEGFHYNVYHKDDDVRKKPIYMGSITKDGKFLSCTCTGGSILGKCYHAERAREITEIPIE